MVRRVVTSGIVLAALVGVSSCSVEVHRTGSVSADKMAARAADRLEEQFGSRPNIDCGDEPFDGKVGVSRVCTLTAGSDPTEYDVTITITAVDGTDVSFHLKVADGPRS